MLSTGEINGVGVVFESIANRVSIIWVGDDVLPGRDGKLVGDDGMRTAM